MGGQISIFVLIFTSVMFPLAFFVEFVHADTDDINTLLIHETTAGETRGSFHVKNECCQRDSRIRHIGESEKGERLEIDVGRCKRRCSSNQKHLKKKHFQKLLKENPLVDPMELYKLHVARRSGTHDMSCPKGKMCEASQSRVDKILTKWGTATVTIVEECSCQPSTRQCRRHSRRITLNKNTPLEVTLDVGVCRGHCGRDFRCKPTTTRTVSTDGPNGAECVSIIDDCSCTPPCYRASHFQQYYDYSQGVQDVKIVDEGKCIGGCSADREKHCIEKDDNGERCLMSLATSSECRPLRTNMETIVEANGFLKNISTVSHCLCY